MVGEWLDTASAEDAAHVRPTASPR
jgi:hypothetical protein